MSDQETINNSLTSFAYGINPPDYIQNVSLNGFGYSQAQSAQTATLALNLRHYLVSNQRNVLAELYVENGLVQALIDLPVDDGFRSGFDIRTNQLNHDEIQTLYRYLDRNRIIEVIKDAVRWSRLFGGGGILIITGEDPAIPLNISRLKENQPLAFKAIDMWELYDEKLVGEENEILGLSGGEYFTYYGRKVHKSRVLTLSGKKAPSYINRRLRGWGMSEIERVVSSLNKYIKHGDMVFELIDEAKIDVYSIDGFNSQLGSVNGTANVTKRVQAGNMLKNFLNAIVMDTKDTYEQKQMNFAGLGDIYSQIRMGIASDLRMPMTKLFGISAAGFSSGEDDIENYNAMVETERGKSKYLIIDVIGISCQHLFGFAPDDIEVIFAPLRILSAKDEQDVKDKKFTRVMKALDVGIASVLEAKQAINKDGLLPIDLDESVEELEIDPNEDENTPLVKAELNGE